MAARGESTESSELSISARQRLITWANQQDGWVRSIVGEVLATRRGLSDASLAAIRSQYLIEKQLEGGEAEAPPVLSEDSASGDVADPLVLTNLRGCDGVNALAPAQNIAFNPKMTILFGENAAGKTGYVRILKLLADVRSAETIIPDIHRPSAANTPEAVVDYSLGANTEELAWHGERGVSPFTRMTVFDSPAVALHLADDVTYVYTPADLALFGYAHSAIDGVKGLLQADVQERLPRQNPFVTGFARGTDVFPKIEALSASTNLSELEDLATVGDQVRTELDTLKTGIASLSSPSGAEIDMLKTRAVILENLITVGNSLRPFDAAAFVDAVRAEDTARRTQADLAASVFGGGQLPEEVRPAWQRFIEAGEQYLFASDRTTYPTTDDTCIYCQQALSDSAQDLLQSYRDYSSGAGAEALRMAADHVTTMQQPLLVPVMTSALERLRATLPSVVEAEAPPDWTSEAQALAARGEDIRNAVQQKHPVSELTEPIAFDTLLPRFEVALHETQTAIQGLEGDAAEKRRILSEQQAKVAQLEARLRLAQVLPDIRKYVDDAGWADRLKTLLGRFQGLLASLTSVSKAATEDALNHDFERVFYEECRRLRAPTVTLDFPGRRGRTERRKLVSRDYSLSDILSEGEQKVIAIADFLAEASLRTGAAPIIFDDPVNSFDYRRVGEIAKRIASLSDEHQVIVFTHDIWFTADLLAEFEGRSSDCQYYKVEADNGVKGKIIRATHPRLDSLNSFKGRINAAIQDISSCPDEEKEQRLDSAYSEVRAWCEIVVETKLLNKVTQRHQPNVAMQNLEGIRAGKLQAAIDVVYPIWEKCNRYTEAHSQPLGTLSIRPSLNELKQDWADLQQALKDYEA
jgi:recombinational DNA repair ATPase RecF